MKHMIFILVATLMHLGPALAEDRAVANATDPQQYDIAAYDHNARSFFEPKTLADLNAMASLDSELESSLSGEDFN